MTLDPELVISGSVTDAVTGKPVPRFRVIQGSTNSETGILSWFQGKADHRWWRMSAVEYTGGRYSMKFDMPSEGVVRAQSRRLATSRPNRAPSARTKAR